MELDSLTFTLAPHSHGDNRLDKLLVAAMAMHEGARVLSRARLQSLIRDGRLRLQGEVVRDPSYKLRAPTQAELTLPPRSELTLKPLPLSLSVVYEDDSLLVVDKPVGLTVHPGAGNSDNTLVNALLHRYGRRAEANLACVSGLRPGIVHRLDKDTGGLLVVAKDEATHAALSAQFAARTIGRRYKAVVRGVLKPLSGIIDSPIGRHPVRRKRMLSGVSAKHGRRAITHYHTEEVFAARFSLLTCRLETGRTHQIRVHLSSLAHGLVGDKTYGGAISAAAVSSLSLSDRDYLLKFPRQALHAEFLAFVHPSSEDRMEFYSPLPADFERLIEVCRKIV